MKRKFITSLLVGLSLFFFGCGNNSNHANLELSNCKDSLNQIRDLILRSKECRNYIKLLDKYDSIKASKLNMISAKGMAPVPCANSLDFAKDYLKHINAPIDTAKEPAAFYMDNAELAHLISFGSQTILVLGKVNENNYYRNCIILFPRKGALYQRDDNYNFETHETFPVLKTLTKMNAPNYNYDSLFKCQ